MKIERFIGFCIVVCLVLFSCHTKNALFQQVPASASGIDFNNVITENDSINILDYEYVYNGGGVAVGDFNRDGLQDIYFSSNMAGNRLYLNKGNFKFSDISSASGTEGEGKWCTGVDVIDINNDGWPDIYVCATRNSDPKQRENILYINQGTDKNGIPVFKDEAAQYGLADTSYSTQAAFFDYDNDGDLDVFIMAAGKIQKQESPNVFLPLNTKYSSLHLSKLYRNDWNDSLKHPFFTNVSEQAGIVKGGFGLGLNITDINRDGWKDILVSNDYLSNDLLWINNGNGTFTDRAAEYFKHTSYSSMGNDVEDINNDGLADIMELDMSPEGNYRKKTMLNPNNYQTILNFERYGYQYEYGRNTLQLNQGPRVLQNDSLGAPVFSEIGFMGGVSETDWSWSPLVADFDNDGYRDIIISNGFPKDISDHDFIFFRNHAIAIASKEQLIEKLPAVKIPKYAFKNNGDLSFSDVSKDWGFTLPAFSNGAAYADLDNDGDLDVIINNINDKALVYRNTERENNSGANHYLNIKFTGARLNINGLGAWVELHYDQGKQQVYENTPYRGYLSTIGDIAHFGLGKTTSVDSVLIKWPDGKMQLLRNVKADRLLNVNIRDANLTFSFDKNKLAQQAVFREITDSANIHYQQQERDFIDFNIQKLLPHKLSEYGPALAVGDIDGNGLDDLVTGGSGQNSAMLFMQQPDGRFIQKPLLTEAAAKLKNCDDLGILLFDADGDGDMDLYIASGSNENERNSENYQDRFYINDGKGNFTADPDALPKNLTSKLCVRAADFDHDGDLDLFISGRVDPGAYPKPVNSYIYRNDSKNGHVQFTDVTSQVAPSLKNIGMVCDALWTDYNNDGWPDLILAGEWMPVTFLENDKGVFKNLTAQSGVAEVKGWWNSITAGDFDNDGDMDYIVGNLGLNSFYKASPKYPVRAYGKDFDNNGIYDMIPSLYLKDQQGDLKEYPAEGRDDMLKQLNSLRKKFPSYRDFALATMNDILSEKDREGALLLEANEFRTCFLRNDGNGRFSMHPLPNPVQISMINGMVVDDFDEDGNLDVLMTGNDYGTEPSVGRYDALNGLLLRGDGKGDFHPLSIEQSGIFIPGNGKALVELRGPDGKTRVAASQNRGFLKLFSLQHSQALIPVKDKATEFMISLNNGQKRRQEIYYGSSFLSQSGRYIKKTKAVRGIQKKSSDGKWVAF